MRYAVLTLIAICNFLFLPLVSKSTLPAPADVRPPISMNERIADLKIKDIQKLIGRKLTLKEKISIFLLKKTTHTRKNKGNLGKTALIFSIGGLVLVCLAFIPALAILIIPGLASCIAGVALGAAARKRNPNDVNGTIAFWIGLITLILFVALLVIALATAGWI